MPTEADVDKVVVGGTADVFLSHDAPNPPYCTDAVRKIIQDHGGWSQAALEYAAISGARLTRAIEGVKPRLHLHSHYHVRDSKGGITYPDSDRQTEAVSLDMEERPGALVLLDLTDLSWRWL